MDPRSEDEVLRSVIGYCRYSQELAGSGGGGDLAVGLARGYQDVADKLQERLDALDAAGRSAKVGESATGETHDD